MVLREQHIGRLEIDWLVIVDPWQTYDSVTACVVLIPMTSGSYSGLWKKHTPVCSPWIAVFEITHIAN